MGAVTTATEPDSRPPQPEDPSAAPPGRRRAVLWGILALWVGLLAIAGPLGGELADAESNDTVDYLPESADSTQVVELQERLPGGEATEVIIVYERDGGLTDADREAARTHVGAIAADHQLAGDAVPQGIPSADGTTEMYPVVLTGLPEQEERIEAVRAIRETVSEGLPDGLTAMVGGPGGLALDNDEVFSSVDGTLTMTTAVVVAVLLIVTYRSPLLWLLPLVCVAVAVMASRALVYGLVEMFDVTVNTMNLAVMSVLVFGAGTDYALLLVARYREELRRHERPFDAMVRAVRGCGPALLASAATVSVGLLCLMAADLNSTAGLGPVGVAGVVCALLVMLTLLPAVLVMCGRRVFWPFIPTSA
jgi:RND superfamily putative drug exporter